eukprot:216207_1
MVTQSQEDAIIAIYVATSSISLIADCLIIFGYFKFRALRKLAFAFVFYIACADFCRSLAQTWGEVDGEAACKIQGWLQTFGAVAMGLLFASIAAVCLSIKKISSWWKTQTPKNIAQFQHKIALLVSVLSILCASIPWNYYEYLSGWCWISDNSTGHIFRYTFYYGWLMACLLFTIIVYCELFRIIRQENKAMDDNRGITMDSGPSVSSISTSSPTDGPSPAPSKMDTKRKQKK